MQTQVVTWAEIITEPKGEVEAVAPIAAVTEPLILGYASAAQFLLQEKSRAVHRTMEFSARRIEPNHKRIDIDDDIWRVTEVRRTLHHKNAGFIKPISLHELRRLDIAGYDSNDPKYGPFRVAVDRRTLFFNLAPSDSEVIHLEYDPYLLPYSVQRAKIPGDWQGCTADDEGFADFIQNNGPEAEFWPQMAAIKAFVGMRLLDKLGNMYVKMHSFMYYAYKAAWENAINNVAGDQPNNTINDAPAAYIGPVG